MREYPSRPPEAGKVVANSSRLTEINFEAAVAQAARLDAHLESTGQVVGPLHGIPISVKVSHTQRGPSDQ
jgi:Asp-tRNA(Asn)/Glu-tRNA(Gln) amidotransferase A subunit family amidase